MKTWNVKATAEIIEEVDARDDGFVSIDIYVDAFIRTNTIEDAIGIMKASYQGYIVREARMVDDDEPKF